MEQILLQTTEPHPLERIPANEAELIATFLEETGVPQPARSEAAIALLDAHAAFSPPSLFKAEAAGLRLRLRAMHRLLLTDAHFALAADTTD